MAVFPAPCIQPLLLFIEIMSRPKVIAVLATLDTKGNEAEFIRDRIAVHGIRPILIDAGILGVPMTPPDVSREQVAWAAGVTLPALRRLSKSEAIARQGEGLRRILQKLFSHGQLDGVIGIGGAQGTTICTQAMQALPLGVPKLMLSTIASGRFRFGPYIGTKDICIMFSVTDIAGINAINRPIFENAANAIAGMVTHGTFNVPIQQKTIAITMLGITTPCVTRIKTALENDGYEVAVFHASGPGGAAMEELIMAGRFAGVLDISTHELINDLFGGLVGTHRRLEALAYKEIPAVISVGGLDVIAIESTSITSSTWSSRPRVAHNAQIIHISASPAEMRETAQVMARRLNSALGPTLVIIPMQGFSEFNRPGGELWAPDSIRAFVTQLQKELRPEIPALFMDAHINDPEFAAVSASCFSQLMQGVPPQEVASHLSQEIAYEHLSS